MNTTRFYAIATACLLTFTTASAQNYDEVNYDESKVPEYVLPDVLTCNDGTRVTTAKEWEQKRRPEVLETFYTQEYGRTPTEKICTTHTLIAENTAALGGLATSQQVLFTFRGQGKTVQALLLVYIPNNRKGRVPVFIGYNFKGNHSVTTEEDILYSPFFNRLKDRSDARLVRGNQTSRWALTEIVKRGYAVATMNYNDIFPDNAKGGPESITALFSDQSTSPEAWQALGAWAWGSSRIADWVEKQPWANSKQMIVIGHSRQGKAALWAGAQDTRFRVVISNDSGCGGAALSKRQFGERVGKINTTFPHWFCRAFRQYNGKEESLPFDQHELLALVAPRHVYVASAEQDRWADPRGEFLAAYNASPVYALYGMKGIPSSEMPAIHHPIATDMGYHIRAGVHDVTDYDWKCYLDFCDKVFGRK